MTNDLAPETIETFRRDGFLHLPHVFTADHIRRFRELREAAVRDWCYVQGTTERPLVVGDLLERYPRAMLPVVAHARLLDLAEEIMGPFVQLDSLILFGSLPDSRRRHGKPVCWHRDRFGSFPTGAYMRPLTLICFAYLQPMTTEAGPLRVIAGSHREPIAVGPDDAGASHPDEMLIATEPGDLVLIHHNLLHSGTHNVTDQERQFLGISYTLTCLRTRDDVTTGPNCRAMAATARRTHDRRLLRLLGHDELIEERQNTGFTRPEPTDWPVWRREDEDHARAAVAECRAVDDARGALHELDT